MTNGDVPVRAVRPRDDVIPAPYGSPQGVEGRAIVMQAVDITAWRGSRQVLTDINLTLHRGELVMVLGPNGAGKSTLLALLAGCLQPDRGVVRLRGVPLTQHGARGRARLGLVFQRHGLPPWLTVRETLTLFSRCYHGERAIADLLARWQLTGLQQRRIGQLSAGQQQRVAVALAFFTTFDVLLLDEPTTGLDAASRQTLWDELQQARARGAAVLYATHLVEDLHHQNDQVLVLHAGQQLALDTPAALLARLAGREKVVLLAPPDLDYNQFRQLPGVTAVLDTGGTVTLYCQEARPVMQALLRQDNIRHLACRRVTLEDVVRLLIQGS